MQVSGKGNVRANRDGKMRRPLARCHAGRIALLASMCLAGPAQAETKPLVIFFGGSGATLADMRKWQAAAQADPDYGPKFTFEAIPYSIEPVAKDTKPADAAAGVAAAIIRGLKTRVHKNIVLVGHSSGVSLAVAVLAGLGDRTVKLILLDGGVDVDWRPPSANRLGSRLECWAATNGPLLSFNHRQASNHCANYHVLNTSACRTALCLHFWLINKNVPAGLGFAQIRPANSSEVSAPYRNLKVNLDWLRESVEELGRSGNP